MSASNNPRPELEDDFFDEPDYDKFSDEELDALARGESIDKVKSRQSLSTDHAKKTLQSSIPVDLDLEPEEIDPALAAELQKELDAEDFNAEPFDEDDEWVDVDSEDLD